ncbi:hypothetical protein PC116_g5018 [Phytophthora cactorum]|uniref:Uncharacterized protein n=1 Tax=Phytophthora cactorum TaxID=29920 RepID=A0A8T1LJ31_9STRA|nr:hypothetical protein Pcac1_g17977 [Phytophthora cactorum]KAG2925367.1 hypothetical protein PC114_g4121 [Phytophthora cactorum]KAG2951679.1 hypothetical protein PC117_g3374 [Phytophthora cactorum]KAG3033461.1 hypothetical protein PC120_g1925 [Phytophthora cactorum]KAG3187483.1 hypothetical protein C6341_g3230 [Phytophthora cactorum]
MRPVGPAVAACLPGGAASGRGMTHASNTPEQTLYSPDKSSRAEVSPRRRAP